ncbi:MAG: vanadium-dependent haloperoxidase [Opitutaceae bacterium]
MSSRRVVCAFLYGLVLSTFSGAAAENPILSWNEEVVNTTRLSRNPAPVAALHFATFHVALFDTVNSFSGTYEGWLIHDRAPEGADPDAAVASAARTVLDALWKGEANPLNIEAAYLRAIERIPEGASREAGVAWGRKVAEAVLTERARTPLLPPEEDYTSTEPGIWRGTPPGFRPPVAPRLDEVKPFVVESASQFRAPPPPAFDSREYAEEIAYVNRVGARDGAERTEYQTLSSPFWSDDLGTASPPGHWNVIARDIVRHRGLSTLETARLYALLNMAAADAGITCWETKYHYRMWRPETAIREMDTSMNPWTQQNPDFIPNMASPAFPSYTSGHSTYTAAMTRLLERFLGTDEVEFTCTSDGLPGAVRSFRRLSEARNEVGMSRIWGGIHIMSDNLEGQKAGIRVADWVFEHSLLPLD